ncbi:MAG: (Fe-S)-binding protein [Limnochordia bacterium]|jgi:glycolate oxidase iron-sulfur subunit
MEAQLAELVRKCSRCGTCRSQCPILLRQGKESSSPRGLIFLLHELLSGRISPSPRLLDKIYTCLLCDACSVVCPSGVDITKIIKGARQYLAQIPTFGWPMEFILKEVLGRPGVLGNCSRFLWLYQKGRLGGALDKTGLNKLLPGDLDRAQAMLPPLPLRSARSRLAVITPAKGRRRYRVGYFLGCATDLLYPPIAEAVVKVLAHHGCEVVIPQDLGCCGLPHLAYGQGETYVKLLKHNLRLWEKTAVDVIISDCASCVSTLAQMGQSPLGFDDPVFGEAAPWASKVYDFSQFLVDVLGESPCGQSKGVVTYHDPCHALRSLGLRDQPRQLMARAGYELRELVPTASCCGGAGSFGLAHYDLSMAILKEKMEQVGRTGAELLATSCPACTMQLSYGAGKFQVPVRVVHPAQLAARCL